MASTINDGDAAIELENRIKARQRFADFSRYINPDEPPAQHHELICDTLDDVIDGVEDRVMLFLPPGSAKSTYSSVRFPAYYLGRCPDKNIICGSYGEGLSTTFGRKVRGIVNSKEYGLLFNTRLSPDVQAKGEWETKDGGSYFACGVGSGVTGRRGDLLLIDDPVKGRKDADSETIRNDTWDWYLADFSTRKKPGAAIIIIQTRWHEDDLSGRILPENWNGESGRFEGFDGKMWKVISIPAEARENDPLGRKPGEWLWTDWFTPEYWETEKKTQTAKDIRNWQSLFQQIPRPESGVFFKREWFKRYPLGEHPPLTLYGASDCAVTDRDDGAKDFTEHGIGGFDKHENLYFVDWWSGQVTMDVWIEAELKLARRYPIMCWVKEVGVIRRSCEPFLIKAKREGIGSVGPTYFRSEWLPHIGDKAANARAFQAMASMGQVYIPNCEWGDVLIDQLVKFIPNTNFLDDKVDVCGLMGRVLDQTFGPTETPNEEEEVTDGYGFDDEDATDWKIA